MSGRTITADRLKSARAFSAKGVQVVIPIWGAERVGVCLSPLGTFNDIGDANPVSTFGHVAGMLSE